MHSFVFADTKEGAGVSLHFHLADTTPHKPLVLVTGSLEIQAAPDPIWDMGIHQAHRYNPLGTYNYNLY